MKRKSIVSTAIGIVVVLSLSTVAFANETVKSIFSDKKTFNFENLTDEAKQQLEQDIEKMEAKMEEQKAKYDALTDEQKQEIKNLRLAAIDNQIETIKKYQEFGLLDEADASEQISRLEETKQNIDVSNFGFRTFKVSTGEGKVRRTLEFDDDHIPFGETSIAPDDLPELP